MSASEPFIRLSKVSKTFPGVKALDEVSLDIRPGEVHALVGENGAGKSTLIKILAGVYNLESGKYFIDGEPVNFNRPKDAIEKGLTVIYQELNLINDVSVADNIFLGNLPRNRWGGVDTKTLRKRTNIVLEKVGIRLDSLLPMRSFPVAVQQLCEVAKALSVNSKLVIMDEPTSALSHDEIEKLFEVIDELTKQNVAILYVSHKMDEIFSLADRISVLRDGKHVITEDASWFTRKSLISYMVGREVNTMFQRKKHTPGDLILSVENLTTESVQDISFDLHKGEVIGFAGLMGSGRTEIARGLYGIDRKKSGSVILDKAKVEIHDTKTAVELGIGMVPEDRKNTGILPNLSVKSNTSISSLKQYLKNKALSSAAEKEGVGQIIESMKVKTPSIEQMIANLSGGNQQKVILSRWMVKKDLKVLIIDEPTRGIDIGSKEEIYKIIEQLAQAGLAIIIISSELPEILSLCDRVFIVKEGRICTELDQDELNEETAISHAL